MRIDGVLFDLDGTMLDTEPCYEKAMGNAVRKLGSEYTWKTQQLIVGKNEIDGAQLIIDDLDLKNLTPEELLEKRDEFLIDLFRSVKLREGIKEFVELLVEQKVSMAIATSSMRKYFAIKTKSNPETFKHFTHIICGDDPLVKHGKPAPDIYIAAAKQLNVDISRCLVLEDSVAGVQSGKSAGAVSVIVSPDVRIPLDVFHEADQIVKEWTEVDWSVFEFYNSYGVSVNE